MEKRIPFSWSFTAGAIAGITEVRVPDRLVVRGTKFLDLYYVTNSKIALPSSHRTTNVDAGSCRYPLDVVKTRVYSTHSWSKALTTC